MFIMKTIEELKNDFINYRITPTEWLGDSPTRFDTYKKYAGMVDSVVEFGVYTGLSTTAFLSGKPKKLRSYDITDKYLTILPNLYHYASQENIDFKFIIGNSLEIDIEETDLLFIDTVHKRKYTEAELDRHASKVKKYIVFHDTTAWPGVFEAAVNFLIKNHNWHIIEHCNKDSGLLILKKYH
jgi:hypothetical protein